MKRVIILVLLVLILIFSGLTVIPQSAILKDDDVVHWAVIITVGGGQGYWHHRLWCKRTVNAMQNVLIDNGWDINNILILSEEDATSEDIFNSFIWLNQSGVNENDVILYYFGMHGYYILEDQLPSDEPDGKDECILPWDEKSGGWSFDNYITDDKLRDEFDKLKSRNIAIIFDTCHSGGMIDGSCDLVGSGCVVITSCAVDEASAPYLIKMMWLFPYFVIEGLKGRADKNNNGWVSLEEAFNYAEFPTMFQSTIFNLIFYFIEPVPLTQHPQIYDGWPTDSDNNDEFDIININ